ncbi:MAG: flagellar brake domain-containing protein [Eubacteriales bacterium]
MLYSDKLFEGLSVEIVVKEGEYKGRYRTKIEEVGKRLLSLGVPIVNGQFMPLREGTYVEVFFSDSVTAYVFNTVVIKRIAIPIPTFIVEFPTIIKKFQRRKFVRVSTIHALKYKIVEKEGLGEEKTGYMIDLSGGGMLLKSDEKIEKDTLLLITILLPQEIVQVPAKAIRYEKDEKSGCYKISLEFHEIPERIRDKLVRHIFDIQREMRKKGLI